MGTRRLWTTLLLLLFITAGCLWWLAAHPADGLRMPASAKTLPGEAAAGPGSPLEQGSLTARGADAAAAGSIVVSRAAGAGPAPQPSPGSQPDMADILIEAGDLSVPGAREKAVARLRQLENTKRAAAQEEGRRRGLPLRLELPGGGDPGTGGL